MAITYKIEPDLSAQEFRDVLIASTLGERRPVNDPERLEKMLRHADIIVVARDGGQIVGVSRAITDYAYCCYLSDLAVDTRYQKQGIGKRLMEETYAAAGSETTMALIPAPKAVEYYEKIGMKSFKCFGISRTK